VFGGGAVVEAEGAGDDRRRGLEHELAERCCPCLGERDAGFVELSAEPDGHKGLADALAGEQPLAARIGGGVHVHAVGGQFGEHRGERFGDWSRRVAQPDEDLAVVAGDDVIQSQAGQSAYRLGVEQQEAPCDPGTQFDALVGQKPVDQGEAPVPADRPASSPGGSGRGRPARRGTAAPC
jgi:hypothetical protein